ncbi:MAG: alpha/beta hydrolase [Polyangiaceae bacterium]
MNELKSIQAGDVRFAYFEVGAGADRPLVLCIHGFPDTPHSWSAVAPAIADMGFRVVAPFTRGYYPTTVPAKPAYDTDTLGRDILNLITALGAESAIVIGHDWGASAAYSAASLGPERVRLLVTIGIPHPASIRPSPRLAWAVRHFVSLSVPGAAGRVRKNDFAHIDELVRRWSPDWQYPPSETEHVKAVFRHPEALDAALGYYRALSPILPASQRKPITVPTLAFAGLGDPIMPPAAYEAARSRFTSTYEVVAVPGAHFMHREHPQAFADALLPRLSPYR